MAKSSNKKSFLDYFKLNDSSDEFDDDLFDDDDDDDDDFDTKPSAMNSRSAYAASTAPGYNSPSPSTTANTQAAPKKQKPVRQTKSNTYNNNSNKLVSINNNRPQYGSSQVYVIKPDEFDDAQMIIDHLRSGQAIVINMEGIEVSTAQRIIDFIAGACYALDGSLQAISGNIFIAAPSEVYVSGDLREELLNDAALSPQIGRF